MRREELTVGASGSKMKAFYRPFLSLALMLRRDRSVYRGESTRRQTCFSPTASARESGSSAFSKPSVSRRTTWLISR